MQSLWDSLDFTAGGLLEKAMVKVEHCSESRETLGATNTFTLSVKLTIMEGPIVDSRFSSVCL